MVKIQFKVRKNIFFAIFIQCYTVKLELRKEQVWTSRKYQKSKVIPTCQDSKWEIKVENAGGKWADNTACGQCQTPHHNDTASREAFSQQTHQWTCKYRCRSVTWETWHVRTSQGSVKRSLGVSLQFRSHFTMWISCLRIVIEFL